MTTHAIPTLTLVESTDNEVATPETNLYDAAEQNADFQLWSALTLGSLQTKLTGTESDPRFNEANELVDRLAKQFAASDPVSIADYFEAIQTVSLLTTGRDSLDEIAEPEYFAA